MAFFPHSSLLTPHSSFLASRRGFTLLELMIAVAIFAVIGTFALLSWSGYQRTQGLEAASQGLADLLREAQGNALNRVSDTAWCVRVTNVAGSTSSYAELYASSDCSGAVQRRVTFSSTVEFSDPADGQTKNIAFTERRGTLQSGGFPVVAYYDSTDSALGFVRCGNAACSANNIVSAPDSGFNIGNYSAVTVGPDGLPVIAYHGAGDLRILKCGNVACTSGNTITTADPADVPQQTAITIGADSLPIVSYWMGPSSLKVLKCGNAACSSGNTLTVVDTIDSLGNIGRTGIAIGADGLPVIAYHDNTSDRLKVLKCGNAACSSGNTITLPDPAGNVGWFPSIAISADGFPVVSYYDTIFLDLKVLKCGNAACTLGNTITAADSTGNVGRDTAIAVAADGLPVIAYYDNTNDQLKVLKCGNAACTSGNTATNIEAIVSGGWLWASVAIASSGDGFPVISYQYVNTNDLRVLKCGNAACSSGNTITTVDSAGVVGEFSSIALVSFEALTFFRADSPANTRTVQVGSHGGIVVQ
ncbi:MAG: prepilin-type N-terminal cleavage/methylation domain-containing protein [Candidatus Terrybacteria bacterium]|nr:prepilin-type N-terminal cleavage/methylation domain-containing protein [Candidatus Terrybacteria bacterium]